MVVRSIMWWVHSRVMLQMCLMMLRTMPRTIGLSCYLAIKTGRVFHKLLFIFLSHYFLRVLLLIKLTSSLKRGFLYLQSQYIIRIPIFGAPQCAASDICVFSLP